MIEEQGVQNGNRMETEAARERADVKLTQTTQERLVDGWIGDDGCDGRMATLLGTGWLGNL